MQQRTPPQQLHRTNSRSITCSNISLKHSFVNSYNCSGIIMRAAVAAAARGTATARPGLQELLFMIVQQHSRQQQEQY